MTWALSGNRLGFGLAKTTRDSSSHWSTNCWPNTKIGLIAVGLANNGLQFLTVGDFVAAKSSKNHKVQQRSTGGVQQVQYQLLKDNKIQQTSTTF